MKWKEIVNDYFSFTRKERIGVVVMLAIIGLAIFLPLFFSHNDETAFRSPDSILTAAIRNLEKKDSAGGGPEINRGDENIGADQYDQRKSGFHQSARPAQLFYFDPNTISVDQWEKLGLAARAIQTIQNYLSKGGRFRKPEDLGKIYGLHKNDYKRLAPYVRIEQRTVGTRPAGHGEKPPMVVNSYVRKPLSYQTIDINRADTAALIQLPGIGPKLASRIISFRDKLGGFYNIGQVAETFGLPDSTFQKIKPYLKLETMTVRKININTATMDELKAHPYIRYNIANAIIVYRKEHGAFQSMDDLKKIMIITEDVFRKITPYLMVK